MVVQPTWNELKTLSSGSRARVFEWRQEGERFVVRMPCNITTHLTEHDLETCLRHFLGGGWFALGASMTDPPAGGLGDYFRVRLRKSSRYPSHFAAILVHLKRLEFKEEGNAILLRVVS